MRITADLLHQVAEQRTNALEERELILRGLGILVVENLSATVAASQLDALDLSHNRLSWLDNFPKLTRLTSIYASHNQISEFTAAIARTMATNVPNVKHLCLGNNKLASASSLYWLTKAFPRIEWLSLQGNPVTFQLPYYKWLILYWLPQLRVLDYQRIRPAERKLSLQWAKSAAGAAVLEQLQSLVSKEEEAVRADHNRSKTFVPGESLPVMLQDNDNGDDDNDNRNNTVTFQKKQKAAAVVQTLSLEQKEVLRQLLQEAESEAEIQDIQFQILQQGMTPEQYSSSRNKINNNNKKRPATPPLVLNGEQQQQQQEPQEAANSSNTNKRVKLEDGVSPNNNMEDTTSSS